MIVFFKDGIDVGHDSLKQPLIYKSNESQKHFLFFPVYLRFAQHTPAPLDFTGKNKQKQRKNN
jgi:hypothetical protein